ncbi:MAG: ROK family protein [Clostridiales bacterium]|nr:ROK family protein [Clostridiales bacterium]
MRKLIGVDIGGTKCAITLGNLNSEAYSLTIMDKMSFPTMSEMGLDYTLGKIYEGIEGILKINNYSKKDIHTIGVSCGGPLNSREGIIMSPPNLIGWDDVHIVELLESRFGIKTKLQNDANACALAEWKFGAGMGFKNVIFLTFGTGLGAGLILNGKIYNGTNDMAGEVGHIRLADNGPVGFGKAGSFEGFCSGGGITQLAKTKVLEKLQMGKKVSFCKSLNDIELITAKLVSDAAKDGDELAIDIYKQCGRYLGKGLSILIDILNPELIIIGSIFTRSAELLWPEAKKVITKESLSYSQRVCKVVSSGLKEKIGDYAALAVAVDE